MSVLSANRVVVVDIFADWCTPCKKIEPQYAALASAWSTSNIKWCKENLDNGITKNLQTVPFFQIFVESKLVETVVGGNMKELNDKLAKYVNSQSQSQVHNGKSPFGSNSAIRSAPPRFNQN